MRGGDELVRVGLDADGDPDLHPLPLPQRLGDVRDPDDLLERVEHDPPHADLDGRTDLVLALVVAVERDALGGHPGGEGGGELPTRTHVEVQPLLLEPPHDGPGEERLPGVEDVGVLAEGLGPGAAAGAEVGLVEEVGGVPNSSARSVTLSPPTVTTPRSSRSTVRDHTLGSRTLRSAGGAE